MNAALNNYFFCKQNCFCNGDAVPYLLNWQLCLITLISLSTGFVGLIEHFCLLFKQIIFANFEDLQNTQARSINKTQNLSWSRFYAGLLFPLNSNLFQQLYLVSTCSLHTTTCQRPVTSILDQRVIVCYKCDVQVSMHRDKFL